MSFTIHRWRYYYGDITNGKVNFGILCVDEVVDLKENTQPMCKKGHILTDNISYGEYPDFFLEYFVWDF